MEPSLKWNKIILAVKIILAAKIMLFKTCRLKWNQIILAAKIILFQMWFRATLKFFEIILF